MFVLDLIINQKSQLEKLEHKIDASLINAAKYLSNIIMSLKEIHESKLYILRNYRSIREYILKMDYPKKLNIHISNIFLKMQILDYCKENALDYVNAGREIGESKLKVLVQTKKKIGDDITLFDFKNHSITDLEKKFRDKPDSEATDSIVPGAVEESDVIIKRKDVKKVEYDVENDRMVVTFYKGRM